MPKRLHLLWIFIPSYIFFYFAFKWIPDVPIYDDIPAVLKTVIDWKKMGWVDRFFLLFRQHNEHRLFPSRILYISYYYLTGGINFNVLRFIGDSQMFIIDIGKSVIFFICSLGTPFSFDYALPWGLVVLGILLYSFPYKTVWKDKSIFPVLCILAFAICSMLMAAIFRGASDDAQPQASRYMIYQQICLSITFILLIRKVKKPVTAIAICLPIFILAWSMNCQFGKAMFEVEANRCTLYQGKYRFYYPPVRMQEAIDISREADSLGIYSIDDHR